MEEGPSLYTGEFFTAWETFAEEIKLAFQYEGGEDEKTRPIAVRQTQFVLANLGLAKLLGDVGQRDFAAHFYAMAEALQDVCAWEKSSAFQGRKIDKHVAGKRGRRHDTSETWRVRASLCLAIQYLMAGGMDQDEAVAFVLRKHGMDLLKLLRPGSNLKSAVPTWIKTFATDATSNEVALFYYKYGMRDLAALHTTNNKSTIRELGAKLVESAALRASKLVKI